MRHALWIALSLAGCAASYSEAPAPRWPSLGELGAQPRTFTGCIGRCAHGAHGARWEVRLERGDAVLLEASATGLDPVLEVRGPSDFRARNDGAYAGPDDAALYFVAPSGGLYEVSVASAAFDGCDEASARGPCEGGEVMLAASEVGAVAPLDVTTTYALDAHAPAWLAVDAEAGAMIRLRLTSTDFDPVLGVFAPTGFVWVNDDAHDRGPNGDERPTDATVLLTAPASGRYLLAVSAYGGGAGAYRVAADVHPPVFAGADGEPPASGWAGPRREGRVLGLFAGISAYPGEALYGCADDARALALAMRATGVMAASDQRVLLDGAATRDALVDALAWLVDRAGPEDVVIVFYSGHGETRPALDDPSELDGLDETLVLVDGIVTDTELAGALDGLGAATALLAIDACYAGGFAEDFVRRPGRMGIFSSDEDVLSHTAEVHAAGGYLSHHLRRAVLGGADLRPRDGYLRAGELTDGIYDGFVRDHRRMNPEGASSPAQRLVVDRGSVGWDSILWAYPRPRSAAPGSGR